LFQKVTRLHITALDLRSLPDLHNTAYRCEENTERQNE